MVLRLKQQRHMCYVRAEVCRVRCSFVAGAFSGSLLCYLLYTTRVRALVGSPLFVAKKVIYFNPTRN